MAGTETITLRLVAQDLMSGNVSKAISGLDRLAKRGGLVGSVIQGVGQSFGQMLNPVGLVTSAIGMATDFMGDSIKAASDQAEAMSKVTVVFGEQADEIKSWANAAAGSMGLTKTAALDAAGSLGNLFDGLGIAEDAGRSMSKSIVQLAADLGSFNNVATDEALVALKSGLLGEAEPMRKFGSALNAARVEAYALANGMYEVVEAGGKQKRVVSEANKVQARYALILKDTKNAQGDFARTADGMANSTKTINASFEDMKVKVGEALKDAISPFLAFMVDIVNQAPNTSNAVGRMTQKMRDMIEAQKDQIDTSQEQVGLFDWVGREIYGFISPQDKLISDYTNNNKAMVAALGVSRKEFALFVEAGLTAGLTLEQITATTRKLQGEVGATAGIVSDAWTGMTERMASDSEDAGFAIYGGLVKPTKRAIRDMFATAADAKAPWKAAMKALAEAGKDPFSDKNFADWMRRKAKKLVDNARREYKNGGPDMRKQAQALAYVMTNPILVALAQTEEEIQRLANARLIISRVDASTGNYSRNGSSGQHPAAGQHNVDGGVEAGRQLNSSTVNVVHIGSLSERDGADLARTIDGHLQRHRGRTGR